MQRNHLKEHQDDPKEILMNFKLTPKLADEFRTICKKEYRNMLFSCYRFCPCQNSHVYTCGEILK